jgi:RNA polymerase sigma-70 factor (ECF subfamily)
LSIRYCGNRIDAEDVLHDAFIKILSNVDSFTEKPNASFEGWLKRITINTALNFVRSRLKTNLVIGLNPLLEELPEEPSDDESFVKPGFSLSQDTLLQMVCELPDGYRTVFNLYVFEQYSHKEIALELNCTENTSKTQLFKARAYLRKKILEKAGTQMFATG